MPNCSFAPLLIMAIHPRRLLSTMMLSTCQCSLGHATDELEPEAKEEIMEEAGVPKEQQESTTLEDAITGAPAADAQPTNTAEANAAASLDEKAPIANVNFSADNA